MSDKLSEIVPDTLSGWQIKDLDISDSPESSNRISKFLNFDDSISRVFKKDDIYVGLYIAYWTPGKTSYRWAGAHTPDTCWVLNGWTREGRKHAVPIEIPSLTLKPAEFGVYSKDGNVQNVHFWHLVGGVPYGYDQEGVPNIFGALIDIKHHGLNLRQEQFFIRLSSNRPLSELKATPGFDQILNSLSEIGLKQIDGIQQS